MNKWTFLCMLVLISVIALGNANADSLKSIWYNDELSDSLRLKAISTLSWDEYVFNLPDSAIYFSQEQLKLAIKMKSVYWEANALNTQGVAYWVMGNFEKAIQQHEFSLQKREEIKDDFGIATSLGNLGLVYSDMGNYEKAKEYYSRSLALSKEINYQKGIANALDNIGIVYSEQGQYSKAIDYYSESLKIKEEINDKSGMANSLNNIGVLYLEQQDFENAIEYYSKSLEIREGTGNQRGMAVSYNNLGLTYERKGEFTMAMGYYIESSKIYNILGDKKGLSQISNNLGIIYQKLDQPKEAMEYYQKSLQISREMDDRRSTAIALINLGTLFFESANYEKSIMNAKEALNLSEEINANKQSEEAAQLLYKNYKSLSNFQMALNMLEKLNALNDTIDSEENNRALIKQEYRYKYEKEALADSLKAAEEVKLADERLKTKEAELSRQKTQKYSLTAGVFILLVFGGMLFKRFKESKHQNKVIEKQKKLVEESHKEITDSITYAKRIQNAILPPKGTIESKFEQAFVFYLPKDVVAGDFYWYHESGGQKLIAAADCTGHGVPGAMVSVVCNNALNRSVKEFGLTDPGKILDKTREIVLQEFEKSDEEVSDGMDIALINITDDRLIYAGANNPMWIIRGNECMEYKANKQPIGKYSTSLPYLSHQVQLQKGDVIYLFTDGYVDQFGGPKGKKMMHKAFKSLLIRLNNQSMREQKESVKNHFDKWKATENQVDDVCVIGIRV